MKYYNLFASAVIVTSAQLFCHALPAKRADVTDTDILNFALTLEHLEDTFYRQFLSQFTPADFSGDGFPDFVRGRFEQIGEHEKTHVDFLTSALQAANTQAVQPCTYKFPVQTPLDFVAVASALETVGSSAYSGAANLLNNKNFVEAGAIILAVEARHSAWINSAVKKQNPWSGSFETPLGLNQVFTIASQFIVSCPDSNPKLPVTAFPSLTVPANAKPGQTVKFSFTAPSSSGQQFVAFLSGLDVKFVPLGQDNTAQIPNDLIGTVYAIVADNNSQVSDAHTVAGPALLMFPFNSRGEST